MKIIRDNDGFDIFIIPLLFQWGIRRCNVRDCTNKPNTIVIKPREDILAMGLCEDCFQQGNIPGGTIYKLEFNDFDAFKNAAAVERNAEEKNGRVRQ